jgi:hypothetical protein
MKHTLTALLAALLLTSACTPKPDAAKPDPKPDAAKPDAQADAKPDPKPDAKPDAAKPALCDELLASHRELVKKHELPEEDLAMGSCHPSPKGTWAVRALTLAQRQIPPEEAEGAPPELIGRWSVVFVAPGGERIEGFPADGGGTMWAKPDEPNLSRWIYWSNHFQGVPFDYDGDGQAELALNLSGDGAEAVSFQDARVLQVRDGKFEHYKPSEPFDILRIEDLNGDKRPDLVLDSPFESAFECGLDTSPIYGPELYATSKPDGTFVQDDPLAHAKLKEVCPSDPTATLALRPSGPDDAYDQWMDLFQQIACARLWGADKAKLKAKVAKLIPKDKLKPKPEPKEGEYQQPECFHWEDFAAWTQVDLPLTLKK